jgi:hypothetical protein
MIDRNVTKEKFPIDEAYNVIVDTVIDNWIYEMPNEL